MRKPRENGRNATYGDTEMLSYDADNVPGRMGAEEDKRTKRRERKKRNYKHRYDKIYNSSNNSNNSNINQNNNNYNNNGNNKNKNGDKYAHDVISTNFCHGSVTDKDHKVTLWTDWANVLLLVLLYTIQGVPTGLVFGSVPFLIQQRTSYTELGILSLCGYPYSLKILWSPIVDSYSVPWIGRRKTWILPTQLLAGGVMLFVSRHVNDLFYGETVNMPLITATFFLLVLLMATQDIAVDGWALEMLHARNVGYASTCQTIGLALGHFISYTIFLALNSPEFCNSYLRSVDQQSSEGMLSLSSYLWFWGIAFIVATVLVMLKTENGNENGDEVREEISVREVYKQMLSIVSLPSKSLLLCVHFSSLYPHSHTSNLVRYALFDPDIPDLQDWFRCGRCGDPAAARC